jgi:hypothetical protein
MRFPEMSSSTHVIVVLDRETVEYMRALLLYSTYTVVVVYPVINFTSPLIVCKLCRHYAKCYHVQSSRAQK